MIPIEQQIEDESFRACEAQQAAHKKAGIVNHWTAPEVDCYEMGFETGALWAMRWWAERFNKVAQPVTGNLSLAETIAVIKSRQPDYDELFAAAAEILGEGK